MSLSVLHRTCWCLSGALCAGCLVLLGSGVAFSDEIPMVRHVVQSGYWGASSVRTGDLDGDGDLDVVAARRGTNIASPAFSDGTVDWWENDGTLPDDGTPWPVHSLKSGWADARSVCVANLDGDEDLDVLAVAHGTDDSGGSYNYDGEILWWENDGGVWTEHTVDAAYDRSYFVCAADVDGDGAMDVVGCSTGFSIYPNAPYQGEVTWWRNGGDGLTWTKYDVWSAKDLGGPDWMRPADLDGDEDLDLLVANSYDHSVVWWENDDPAAGGDWTQHPVYKDANTWRPLSVDAADFDGDGDLDVVAPDIYSPGRLAWWANDGDGAGWDMNLIDAAFTGAFTVYAVDADRDGDVDVAGGNRGGGEAAWWDNTAGDGTTWTRWPLDTAGTGGARDIYAADILGDGAYDVLSASEYGGTVTWWDFLDEVLPVFNELAAVPDEAEIGSIVTITFVVSELLDTPPVVTVNGTEAIHQEHDGTVYLYTYLVPPGASLGGATIEIVGQDPSGNAGSLSTDTALTIVPYRPVPLTTGWVLAAALLFLGLNRVRRRSSLTS